MANVLVCKIMSKIVDIVFMIVSWIMVRLLFFLFKPYEIIKVRPNASSLPTWHPQTLWFIKIRNKILFTDWDECELILTSFVKNNAPIQKFSCHNPQKLNNRFSAHIPYRAEVMAIIVIETEVPTENSIGGFEIRHDRKIVKSVRTESNVICWRNREQEFISIGLDDKITLTYQFRITKPALCKIIKLGIFYDGKDLKIRMNK